MALSRKKATTIALDPVDDRLLSRAARERGISRAEFVRQHLALVLERERAISPHEAIDDMICDYVATKTREPIDERSELAIFGIEVSQD
jgi:hypothetical protein